MHLYYSHKTSDELSYHIAMIRARQRLFYLAAAAVRRPPAAQRAWGEGHVLDDLGEVQVDLQQQVLAPLAHRAKTKAVLRKIRVRSRYDGKHDARSMESTFRKRLRMAQPSE